MTRAQDILPCSGCDDLRACPGTILATFRSFPARNASSGFTLIELMVVMLLIGILSAMILPEMKGTFGDALLRSSGRDLINVFKLAYSQAVSLNQVHIVRLDQKNGRFSVEKEIQHGAGTRPEYVPLKNIAGSSGTLDERIVLEIHRQSDPAGTAEESAAPLLQDGLERASEENAVFFYPDGTADGSEILLRDRAGFGLRLRVDPITARVEVRDLPRSEPGP